MSSVPRSVEQASNLARAAIENDNQGNLAEAATLYERAADLLLQALNDPSCAAQHDKISNTMRNYRVRAQSIREQLAGAPGDLPLAPGSKDKALADLGPNPSVLAVGLSTLGTVNREGGKYLVAGYQKASEFNREHNVTGKVAGVACATYSAAANANKEYKITERTTAAVTGTYSAMKEANEKHHITEKVGTVAVAAVTKVGELNKEYRVTERVGGALLSGLNYLSSASDKYLGEKGNAKDGAAPPRPPPPS